MAAAPAATDDFDDLYGDLYGDVDVPPPAPEPVAAASTDPRTRAAAPAAPLPIPSFTAATPGVAGLPATPQPAGGVFGLPAPVQHAPPIHYEPGYTSNNRPNVRPSDMPDEGEEVLSCPVRRGSASGGARAATARSCLLEPSCCLLLAHSLSRTYALAHRQITFVVATRVSFQPRASPQSPPKYYVCPVELLADPMPPPLLLNPPRLSVPVRLSRSFFSPAGKMFVGGLNWDTTDGTGPPSFPTVSHEPPSLRAPPCCRLDALKAYFEQFGKISHCTIMRDSETQRSRGFAFLTFEDPASVNTVMSRDHYLDGKTVRPFILFAWHPLTPLSTCRLTRSAQSRARTEPRRTSSSCARSPTRARRSRSARFGATLAPSRTRRS